MPRKQRERVTVLADAEPDMIKARLTPRCPREVGNLSLVVVGSCLRIKGTIWPKSAGFWDGKWIEKVLASLTPIRVRVILGHTALIANEEAHVTPLHRIRKLPNYRPVGSCRRGTTRQHP